jgi:hypothetical protein
MLLPSFIAHASRPALLCHVPPGARVHQAQGQAAGLQRACRGASFSHCSRLLRCPAVPFSNKCVCTPSPRASSPTLTSLSCCTAPTFSASFFPPCCNMLFHVLTGAHVHQAQGQAPRLQRACRTVL